MTRTSTRALGGAMPSGSGPCCCAPAGPAPGRRALRGAPS
ncbi:hypothetical protein [Acidovorax sp.]